MRQYRPGHQRSQQRIEADRDQVRRASPPLAWLSVPIDLPHGGGAGACGPCTVSFLLLVFANEAGKNEQQKTCSWRAKPSKPPCWEFVSSIISSGYVQAILHFITWGWRLRWQLVR